MANEISFNVTLKVVKGYLDFTRSLNRQTDLDAASPNVAAGTQIIGTTEEVIGLGDVATPGVAWFRNLDTTNFVEIGVLLEPAGSAYSSSSSSSSSTSSTEALSTSSPSTDSSSSSQSGDSSSSESISEISSPSSVSSSTSSSSTSSSSSALGSFRPLVRLNAGEAWPFRLAQDCVPYARANTASVVLEKYIVDA